MPEISQIGFGTNDYATLFAWEAAEEASSYGGNPPVAEIGAGTPALTANVQVRTGWTDGFIIRAASGQEFDGNFGGTHAVLDGAGFTLDIRVANGEIRNLELLDIGTVSTGDSYDNLIVDSVGMRLTQAGYNVYLHQAVTNPVTFTNSIILVEAQTNNQAFYVDVISNASLTSCTVIAKNTSGNNGAIYVRGTIAVNDTACFSTSLAYEESGSPTTSGDYNSSSDGTLLGANSVGTLTADDFVNFGADDLRIKSTSGLVGAGTGGNDIGAFVQPPEIQILASPALFTRDSTATFSVDSPNISLTVGNTTVTSTVGGLAVTVDSVISTGATTYDVNITVPVGLALQHSTLGYRWDVASGAESNTSTVIPLAPEAGDSYTDLIDPSVLEGSMLEGFTGDTPVTGDQVVFSTTSAPTGIPFTVNPDGEWVFDFVPTESQTTSRYVIQADGTVGASAVATFFISDAPVITLVGSDPLVWVQGTTWVDPGANVTDNLDAPVFIIADDAPDVNVPTSYLLHYNHIDSELNPAIEVTREVIVTAVDTTPDPFTFVEIANATINTVYENVQAITGVVTGQNVVATGGLVSNDSGVTYSTSVGMLQGTTLVKATVTTGPDESTEYSQLVTVNGVSDTFVVTTQAGTVLNFAIDTIRTTVGSALTYTYPIGEIWSNVPEEGGALLDSSVNIVITGGTGAIQSSVLSAGVDYLLILRDAGGTPEHYARQWGQFA